MSKKTWEIIFSGVGGQGLVSCGNILGEAASFDHLNAVMTTTYGVETRGTFSKSDLIISDEDIDYPEALHPDVILALAQVAYQRYAPIAGENTVLIYVLPNSNICFCYYRISHTSSPELICIPSPSKNKQIRIYNFYLIDFF